MMKKVMRDKRYIESNGYEVYEKGKKVQESEVKWSEVEKGKENIGIRKKKRIENQIGELKIILKNEKDI